MMKHGYPYVKAATQGHAPGYTHWAIAITLLHHIKEKMACSISLIPLIIRKTSISGFGASPHLYAITHQDTQQYTPGIKVDLLTVFFPYYPLLTIELSTNKKITMYNLLKPIICAEQLAYPA